MAQRIRYGKRDRAALVGWGETELAATTGNSRTCSDEARMRRWHPRVAVGLWRPRWAIP